MFVPALEYVANTPSMPTAATAMTFGYAAGYRRNLLVDAVVSSRRNDERAGVRRSGDCVLQSRAHAVPPRLMLMIGARRCLNGSAVFPECGQSGGVQDALRDVEQTATSRYIRDADRADLDRPIDSSETESLVADSADDTRSPQPVIAGAVVRPAIPETVELDIVGIGRIRIGSVAITVDRGEGSAAAKVLRRGQDDLRDEVVAVVREIRRDVRVIEPDAHVDRRDDDARAPGSDSPGSRKIDHVRRPGLRPVVRDHRAIGSALTRRSPRAGWRMAQRGQTARGVERHRESR